MILYGHIYGAPIVMYAAAKERLMSPILLSSVLAMGEGATVDPYERCVVVPGRGRSDSHHRSSTSFDHTSFREEINSGALRALRFLPRRRALLRSRLLYAEVFSTTLKMFGGSLKLFRGRTTATLFHLPDEGSMDGGSAIKGRSPLVGFARTYTGFGHCIAVDNLSQSEHCCLPPP